MLRPSGGTWSVLSREIRSDLPASLQVGAVVSADADEATSVSAWDHNSTSSSSGDPDLTAEFDYISFETPETLGYTEADLMSDAIVSDVRLIEIFGDTAGQ